MKKFVTTLLALLLTVALAVGFTACDEKEVYDQVTEEEWKSALSLICGDFSNVKEEDLNYKISMSLNNTFQDKSISSTMEWKNNGNAASYLNHSGYDSRESYFWEDNEGIKYRGNYSYDKSYDLTYISKYEIEFDLSSAEFNYNFLFNPWGGSSDGSTYFILLRDANVLNRYSDFELNQKDNGYKLQYVPDERDNYLKYIYDLTLYFRNGEIAKIVWDSTGEVEGYYYEERFNECVVATFTYGSTMVTIPDEVKNTPVSH